MLTELTPALLEAFAGSGDPDAALAAFDAAMARMTASVELLSILRSNDEVRELFGDVLGSAPRLAEVIATRPHVLDAAIDPDRTTDFEDSFSEEATRLRAETYVGQARNFEDALDRARDFAAEEMFLIGLHLLSGRLDPDRAGQAYSALAAGAGRGDAEAGRGRFRRRPRPVGGGRVAVLAMGKLGSREMTAASDLDLILIYDFPADAGESDGAKPLGPGVYYARFTQRLLAALTAPTRRGRSTRSTCGSGPRAARGRSPPSSPPSPSTSATRPRRGSTWR